MNNTKQGLDSNKFHVTRTDGSSCFGKKHQICNYFVLDLNHDKYSDIAILAYSLACEKDYPQLSAELRVLIGLEHSNLSKELESLIIRSRE